MIKQVNHSYESFMIDLCENHVILTGCIYKSESIGIS